MTKRRSDDPRASDPSPDEPAARLRGVDAIDEIGARLGGVAATLKSAFGALSNLADAVDEAARDGDGRIKATSEVRVRVGGVPVAPGSSARSSASARADAGRDTAEAMGPVRDPLVDVFDEDDAWVITAELPGVRDDQLSLHVTDAEVVFETLGPKRFRHVATLPDGVNAEGARHALRNGVLEIRFPKTGATPDQEGDSDE